MYLAFLTTIHNYSNHWHIYFLRFLVVVWFVIWPCIFGLLFLFFKEISKSNKVAVVLSQFVSVRKYSYVFHNFMFLIVFISMTFNTFFFLYTFIDFHILSLNNLYAWIWHLQIGDEPTTQEETLFFGIVCAGYIMHIIATIPYIYFNLYLTESYFGENWRTYISKNLRENRKWIKFKKKHVRLYNFLFPWIFDVDRINREGERGKFLII